MFSIAAWPAAPVAPATVITAVVAATGVASPTILTATQAEPPMVEVTRIVAGGADDAGRGRVVGERDRARRVGGAAGRQLPTPTTVSGARVLVVRRVRGDDEVAAGVAARWRSCSTWPRRSRRRP